MLSSLRSLKIQEAEPVLDLKRSQIYRPVYNVVSVEKLKSACDLCSIEASSGLFELSCSLDLEHQVSSADVLHHEEEFILK